MNKSRLLVTTLFFFGVWTLACRNSTPNRSVTTEDASSPTASVAQANDDAANVLPALLAKVNLDEIQTTVAALATSKYDEVVAKIIETQRQPDSPARQAAITQLRSEFDAVAASAAPGSYVITRSSFSDKTPQGRGIGQAAAWIEARFRQMSNRLTVRQDCFAMQGQQVCNVVAELPGTATGAYAPHIVIGGHYDSRVEGNSDGVTDAPGATDNASGTAVVLEVARIAATQSFPATLVFVAFASEEQGLYGAAHLAGRLVTDGKRVVAMLNNDLVGNSEGNRGDIANTAGAMRRGDNLVRVFTDTTVAGARELWQSAGKSVTTYLGREGMQAQLLDSLDRQGRAGDHKPFLAKGIPAIRFTTAFEDYDHQHKAVKWHADGGIAGDLRAFVDYAYMVRVAQVNLATLVPLALAPSTVTSAAEGLELTAPIELKEPWQVEAF